ncbi:hypothetical protein FQN53_008646 [Emmonsiellopsis sp. PD_33]|nr:hypothetical protein FQN53_008646 [Emmonsiellopsis sp. PD_33]
MQHFTFMEFDGKFQEEEGLSIKNLDREIVQLFKHLPEMLLFHNRTKNIYLVAVWPSFEDAKVFSGRLKIATSPLKEKPIILDYFTIPLARADSELMITETPVKYFHIQQFKFGAEIVTDEEKEKMVDSITEYPICQDTSNGYKSNAEWAVLEMENEAEGPRLIIFGLDQRARVPIGGCWRKKIGGWDKYNCLQPEHCTGERYTLRKMSVNVE